jgi:hypothetical protein
MYAPKAYTTETTTDITSNYTRVQSENTTFIEDATYSPFTTVTESDAMLTPPEAIQHAKCRKKWKKNPDITTVSNVTMTMNVTDIYGNLTDNDSSVVEMVGHVTEVYTNITG